MSRPAWADKADARMCAATSTSAPPTHAHERVPFPPSAFPPRASLDLRAPHDLVAGANAADEPPALLTSDEEHPENSVLIDVSQRGEQGGADSFTHRRSEKPDEIGQWRNATEVCAPHAYSVLMNVSRGKPDFVAPLAPRNLAIFDDALDHYGALDSLYENDMLESVPVAPGEQSNYEQAIAARRTYKRKQSQRASAPSRGSTAVAVASWRRVR